MPGVPGIGVKTAAQLIGEYGDLETLLSARGEIKQEKRRQTLIDNAEQARMSKRLVTLDQNVPLDVPVDDLAVHEPDYKHLIAFLKAMEFNTLTRRVAEKSGIDAGADRADAKLSSRSPPPRQLPAWRRQRAGQSTRRPARARPRQAGGSKAQTDGAAARPRRSPRPRSRPRAAKIDRSKYESVRTLDRLEAWIARAHDAGVVAIDTETTSLDPMQRELCGFSLARRAERGLLRAARPSRGRRRGGGDLFAPEAKLCAGQIPEHEALAVLKPLLEDPAVLKIGQNLKYDWLVFAQRGIESPPTTTPC